MIQGVIKKDIMTHEDQRGFFREVFRFKEEFTHLQIGQLSHSLVNQGVIKAWHGHVYQSQWNYVVSGEIRCALHDNRPKSRTYQETVEFALGNEKRPIAYFFPPGVMHAYRCIKGPMHIIYVTSGVYDLDDEIRLTSEELKIALNWL